MTPPQDKRQAILAATLELIAEGGFHGAPAAQIAARAGIGVGTIYRHFSDKDALIHALFQEQEQLLRQELCAQIPPEGDLRTRFLAVGLAMFRYFVRYPERFRFVEQYYHSPYGTQRKQEHYFGEGDGDDLAPLVRLFRSGRSSGHLKAWPLSLMFALTIGPLSYLLRDCYAGFLKPDEAQVEALLTIAWEAMRP